MNWEKKTILSGKNAALGSLDIETLILRQEKEEFLAREKVNGISKELALLLREEEAHTQALRDLEKEKVETERIFMQCRADIGATNGEIEGNRKSIRRIEEENKGLKEKAGFGEAHEIPSFIKELEEKESLLRDRKSEVSAKLALASQRERNRRHKFNHAR